MQYTKVSISVTDSQLQEVLIARLAEMGFDGFEESASALDAFIPEAQLQLPELAFITHDYQLSYTTTVIAQQNWNALWESNFEPVQVAQFVGIRAAFHPPFTDVQHELVITPKMSFGTGHHATTYCVMQLMEQMEFKGKSVFDFGTGTGILAILAEKLGAAAVLGVDHDDWCIENARENALVNYCKVVDIQKLDTANAGKTFDIILANINKQIILENLSLLTAALVLGGKIVLSGLLVADEADILAACADQGWKHLITIEKGGWIAMQFTA